MTVLKALLFLAAAHLGLADRAADARDSLGADFHVIFEKHIPSGTTGLTVWSPDKSTLYGYSCQGPLALQGSELSVQLSDDTGNGVLSFGDAHYTLDYDPDVSGGTSCYSKYNSVHVVVECLLRAVPEAALPAPLAREAAAECFSALEADEGFVSDATAVRIEEEDVDPMYEPTIPEIEESEAGSDNDTAPARARYLRHRRQGLQDCHISDYTHPFNNGSPHRRMFHRQVTVRGPFPPFSSLSLSRSP